MGKLDRQKKRAQQRAQQATKRDDRPMRELAAPPVIATHEADDAPRTALEARARKMGWGKGRKELNAAKSPLLSCGVGLALRDTLPQESAMQAWETWADWCGIVHRYRAFKTGKTGQPDSSRFESDRNRAESNDSRGPDLRTWDERFVAAANKWIKWEGYVMTLPRPQIDLLRLSLETDDGWADGPKATAKGRALAKACRALDEVAG